MFHICWSLCHYRSSILLCPESSFLAPEIGILFGDAVGASLVRSPCCQLVVAMSESTKRGRSPNANKHKQPPSALNGKVNPQMHRKNMSTFWKIMYWFGFSSQSIWPFLLRISFQLVGFYYFIHIDQLELKQFVQQFRCVLFFFRYGRLCSRHSPVGFQSYLRTGGEPNHHWQSISAVKNDAILIEPRRRRTVQVGAGKAGTQTNLRFLTKFQNLSSISSGRPVRRVWKAENPLHQLKVGVQDSSSKEVLPVAIARLRLNPLIAENRAASLSTHLIPSQSNDGV